MAEAEIEIRFLKVRDITELLRLIDLCWQTHNYPYLSKAVREARHWRSTKPDLVVGALMRNFAIACIDGEIVGYSQFNYDIPRFGLEWGMTSQLYVHPDHCGKGIGTRLFAAVLSIFERRGRTNVFLTCLAKNRRTRTFYERLGGIEFLGELFGPADGAIPLVYYGFGQEFELRWTEITGTA